MTAVRVSAFKWHDTDRPAAQALIALLFNTGEEAVKAEI